LEVRAKVEGTGSWRFAFECWEVKFPARPSGWPDFSDEWNSSLILPGNSDWTVYSFDSVATSTGGAGGWIDLFAFITPPGTGTLYIDYIKITEVVEVIMVDPFFDYSSGEWIFYGKVSAGWNQLGIEVAESDIGTDGTGDSVGALFDAGDITGFDGGEIAFKLTGSAVSELSEIWFHMFASWIAWDGGEYWTHSNDGDWKYFDLN